jgi:hypothetical protein
MARLPKTFGDLIFHRREIPIDETASLARVLIEIEEDTNPSDVGGGIQMVKVLPDGRAYEIINRLSKTAGTKKKQR